MMRLHEEARIGQMSKVLDNLTPKERQEVTAALRTLIRAVRRGQGPGRRCPERGPYLATSKVLL